MRRLSVTSVLAGLALAAAAWGTAGPAQAVNGYESRAGFCAQGEGLAVVLDFRNAPEEERPAGNALGYEVRCLSGPNLATLDLSGSDGSQYLRVAGLAELSDGTFNLTRDFSATGGTIDAGWSSSRNTPWAAPDNTDKFVGFTYSPKRRANPILEPQFSRLGAGGPDQGPGPGAPSTGGGTTPDRVGGGTPDRVGDPDRSGSPKRSGSPRRSADPDDPDARAPGGEARSESAEETPEPTESPQSDQTLTGGAESQELEPTDSLTGGPMWLWITVIALVVVVYLAVTWLVIRARRAARAAAGS